MVVGPGAGGFHCDPTDPSTWWPFASGNHANLVSTNGLRVGPGANKVMGRSAASEIIGTTPQEIHQKFAGVINAQFQYGATEQLVSRLSDRELSDIARLYERSSGRPIANSPLLKTFATRLSDQSLLRVASVVGRGAVEGAVMKYATPAVQDAFLSKVAAVRPLMLPGPGGGEGGGGSLPPPPPQPPPPLYPTPPSPNWNMTLQEIYLEFRTAPVGSMGVAEALAETAMYAGARVSAAAAIGSAVGHGIQYLIATYDPDLNDAIGGTVASMLENMNAAMSEIELGHYQSAFDELFGYAVTNSGDSSGDWSVASPMTVYYSSPGAVCGW